MKVGTYRLDITELTEGDPYPNHLRFMRVDPPIEPGLEKLESPFFRIVLSGYGYKGIDFLADGEQYEVHISPVKKAEPTLAKMAEEFGRQRSEELNQDENPMPRAVRNMADRLTGYGREGVDPGIYGKDNDDILDEVRKYGHKVDPIKVNPSDTSASASWHPDPEPERQPEITRIRETGTTFRDDRGNLYIKERGGEQLWGPGPSVFSGMSQG